MGALNELVLDTPRASWLQVKCSTQLTVIIATVLLTLLLTAT